ncbi:MAG: hypothetical protein P1U61_02685 [Legionellaceae bacterium]|nr:hypothetical protein [Legionellaceae bacterium]
MRDKIEVLPEAITVHLRMPTKNKILEINTALADWEPVEHARVHFVLGALDDYFALLLRKLFLGGYMTELQNKGVSFSLQLNQVSGDTLKKCFFKQAKVRFPSQINFVCPSSDMISIWVEAVIHAVVSNRLSANTHFDLSVDEPLSAQQLDGLSKALSFSVTPDDLVITYQAMDGTLATLNSSVLKAEHTKDTGLFDLVMAMKEAPKLSMLRSSAAPSVVSLSMWSQEEQAPPLTKRRGSYQADAADRVQTLFKIDEADDETSSCDEREKKEHGCY